MTVAVKITAAEARAFFAHPSQLKAAKIEGVEQITDAFTFYACGHVCGAFHLAHWPGVLMGHIGVKPDAWGATVYPMREILGAAWASESPERIVGWVSDDNRAMQALCRRVGMEIDGRLPLPQPVTLFGWRP